MGEASCVASSIAETDVARPPRFDLEIESVRGACLLGVLLRLLAVGVPHFVGDTLLLGVPVREMEGDCSRGVALAELLSNILMRSLALFGEDGMDSFSGLVGLDREERCSISLAAAATEVDGAASVADDGRDAGPVDAAAEYAALLNMPRIAAKELLTDPAWENGRVAGAGTLRTESVVTASASTPTFEVVSTIASFCKLVCERRPSPEKILVAAVKSVWLRVSFGFAADTSSES